MSKSLRRVITALREGGLDMPPVEMPNNTRTALEAAPAVRRITGFAIGGVAPIGYLSPVPIWMDLRLQDVGTVWAAAGTACHVFPIAPADLRRITDAVVADFATA